MRDRRSLVRWGVLALAWLSPACPWVQPLDDAFSDTAGTGADSGSESAGGNDASGRGGTPTAGGGGTSGRGGTAGNPSMAGRGAGGAVTVAGEGGSDGSAGMPGDRNPVWALWPMPNPASTRLPNPHRYERTLVAGDVVVLDLVTNLTWEHHDNGVFAVRDQAGAQAYCDSVTFAGYDDWRLPTIIELVSIVDFTRNAPAIDPIAFAGTPSFAVFFAATPGLGSSSNWSVYVHDGTTTIFDAILDPGAQTLARCVR